MDVNTTLEPGTIIENIVRDVVDMADKLSLSASDLMAIVNDTHPTVSTVTHPTWVNMLKTRVIELMVLHTGRIPTDELYRSVTSYINRSSDDNDLHND